MTRFSICIPAYNRANHLPALLDSIFAQDYGNYEIDTEICGKNDEGGL